MVNFLWGVFMAVIEKSGSLNKKNDAGEFNIYTIIIALIILFLSIIPFIRNYKYNDIHLAWLNHDYGKNLMTSTEEGSVFMTEGGDNQVFSTLYFMYAEKLRPDLAPYDQKGNIFKRIYGDMRYIDPKTLERRMQLVDSHLFAGEEPFYVNIRDRADPYFIPYWQGRRPVYLTWERPEPWTLSLGVGSPPIIGQKQNSIEDNYGDYYYKRYGIMYKVQNIQYELVDYLELKKEISVSDAESQLSSWLHRTVDLKFTIDKINEMVREGYLRLAGDRVIFIKMYDPPHKGDYFDKFLLRWHDAPNAMYWDVLTREIIINYDYQMGEIYRGKVGELQDIKSREKRPEILAEIDKRIKENWTLAKSFYNDSLIYGFDSISTLHNLAVVYMRNGLENLDEKARELLTRALTLYANSWGTYSLMFSLLINDMFKNPADESRNMKEIDMWMNQLKVNLTHYRSAGGDYTKNSVWGNFSGLDNFINQLRQVPLSQLNGMVDELSRQIKVSPKNIDNNLSQQALTLLYSRGIPFGYQPYIKKADELLDQLLMIKKDDQNFIIWAFSICLQIQKLDKAYEIGKDMERLNKDIPDPSFYYSMGMISYNLKKPVDTVTYLNKFLDKIKTDRKAQIQLREPVQNANNVLSQLKKAGLK